MGASFGGMYVQSSLFSTFEVSKKLTSVLPNRFASGIRAGLEAIKLYDSYEIVDGEVVGPAPVKLSA